MKFINTLLIMLTIFIGMWLFHGNIDGQTCGTVTSASCASGNSWTHTHTDLIIPTGLITLITSGTCPTGFTEASVLNGKMLRGTVAANADVGTTGGNATITPTGTVSAPIFTGTTNIATSAVSAGTPAGTISALTTGADSSTTGGVAKAIAQTPTFTGTAMGTHSHTLTPTGTNSAPTFTGNAIDPSPSYVKVIFCSKN